MKRKVVGIRTVLYVALVLLRGVVLIAAGGQEEAEELGQPDVVLDLTAEGRVRVLLQRRIAPRRRNVRHADRAVGRFSSVSNSANLSSPRRGCLAAAGRPPPGRLLEKYLIFSPS